MDAQQTLTIRTKSSGPKLRAGFVLGTFKEWAEHEIECTLDGFKKLVALVEDPMIEVHAQDEDGNWHPAPELIDLKAGIAAMTPANDAADAPAANTILPAVEPTLEREATDTTGDEATEEGQPHAPDPAQNAAETGDLGAAGDPDAPAPEPAAEAEGKADPAPKA